MYTHKQLFNGPIAENPVVTYIHQYDIRTAKCRRYLSRVTTSQPIPVAVRFKAWVYGRSLTWIVGSNPA
jgi:hypothetical protein